MIGGPLTICRTCRVSHYDNCPTCFGFGVYSKMHADGMIPISASVAETIVDGWIPCPTCKSTPQGFQTQGSG